MLQQAVTWHDGKLTRGNFKFVWKKIKKN